MLYMLYSVPSRN